MKLALGPLRVVVPPSEAPAAPVPDLIATVTDGEAVVRFPNWSSTPTTGAVDNAAERAAPTGCVVNASLLAAPATSVSVP